MFDDLSEARLPADRFTLGPRPLITTEMRLAHRHRVNELRLADWRRTFVAIADGLKWPFAALRRQGPGDRTNRQEHVSCR